MIGAQAGSSVVEMLVASTSALLVVALVASTVPVHARAFNGGRDRQELRSSLRRITDAVAREARSLGFDPIEVPSDPLGFDGRGDGLAIAEPTRLEMRSDHHGSGGSGAPNDRFEAASDERIAFAWSAGTRNVTQSIGGLHLSIAQGVQLRADGFRLRYFDACGRELMIPPGGLGAADRRAVAALEVSVGGHHVGRGGSATETARVALRNRRDVLCPFGAAP